MSPETMISLTYIIKVGLVVMALVGVLIIGKAAGQWYSAQLFGICHHTPVEREWTVNGITNKGEFCKYCGEIEGKPIFTQRTSDD